MSELFSYLNVAETAKAAAVEEATGAGGGGEDELLLHGGNIIEGARGATAAEASSSSLARPPGVSHYPFAFPRYANDDGLLHPVHEHECL